MEFLLAALPVPNKYNCVHFVVDAWRAATQGKEDITGLLPQVDNIVRLDEKFHRKFSRVETPQNFEGGPLLVVMHRVNVEIHVGMWLRGRVWHLSEHGAEATAVHIASEGFQRVSFYQKRL